MKLLLDTHVVLWWLEDNPTLSEDIKSTLDREPEVYVSAASVWEIAIKQAKGKLVAPPDLPVKVRDSGFRELRISFEHAVIAGNLPLIHTDPFDRMLVAQAKHENLTLVTRDAYCKSYGVACLPV